MPTPVTYIVIHRSVEARHELTTRRVFVDEREAQGYAASISQRGEALVVSGDWEHLRVENRTPIFKHDCDKCVFLGHLAQPISMRSYDLYFHGEDHATVIARFGDDGPDYKSGLPAAGVDTELGIARERAWNRGLLKREE